MATVIDITQKIQIEPTFIKIFDKSYVVRDDKNTMTKAMALFSSGEKNESDSIDEIIALLLGQETGKELSKANYPFKVYQIIFIALMAAVQDESFEVVEKRFQDAKQRP